MDALALSTLASTAQGDELVEVLERLHEVLFGPESEHLQTNTTATGLQQRIHEGLRFTLSNGANSSSPSDSQPQRGGFTSIFVMEAVLLLSELLVAAAEEVAVKPSVDEYGSRLEDVLLPTILLRTRISTRLLLDPLMRLPLRYFQQIVVPSPSSSPACATYRESLAAMLQSWKVNFGLDVYEGCFSPSPSSPSPPPSTASFPIVIDTNSSEASVGFVGESAAAGGGTLWPASPYAASSPQSSFTSDGMGDSFDQLSSPSASKGELAAVSSPSGTAPYASSLRPRGGGKRRAPRHCAPAYLLTRRPPPAPPPSPLTMVPFGPTSSVAQYPSGGSSHQDRRSFDTAATPEGSDDEDEEVVLVGETPEKKLRRLM